MTTTTLYKATIPSLLLIAIFTLQSFSQSFDWNLATGGNSSRNGLSTALGPLVEPGGEPELYWSGGENAGVAHYPVIEGENLIVTRRWPANTQEEAWLVNYNVYTGEENWKITLPVNTYNNYSKVSAVNNGVVYANRSGGTTEHEFLYALDIETGDIIWMSEDTYGEHATETVTFTEDGDIIAADDQKLLRINQEDGTTVWQLPRGGSSSDGNAVSVFGDRGYFWDQNAMGMYVSVCDLETGEFLFSGDIIGTPGFQQGCLMVGPDGTVYAPLIRNNDENDSIHALTDKGDYFEQKWSYPIAYSTFGNHGVGPDGTIYTYSRDEEVVRLNPETGEVLNTSIVVSAGNGFFHAEMAIGDDGFVYIAVQDWPFHKLYFFNQELDLLWSEEINGLRGVALGDSVLAINGKNDIVRAYKGRPNPISNINSIKFNKSITVFPNPSNGVFNITSNIDLKNEEVTVEIINVSGEVVYSSKVSMPNGRQASGFETTLKVDISPQKEGIYILRYFIDNKYHFQKIIKQ